MALTNFIPTVWSETLYEELQHNYTAVNLCSREFEGEIKNQGDRVKISGIGPVSVFDYKKNEDMPDPEVLTENQRTLVIDQAKAFNFYIDDIDEVQATPKLMKAAMSSASKALSQVAEKYVYNIAGGNIYNGSFNKITPDNALEHISFIRRVLLENDVPDREPLCLEISPAVESALVQAHILTDTNNSETLASGYVGKVLGFEVYVTNNLQIDISMNLVKCIARTKRAIAFAEQINSVKTYEPEHRHGIAVKGLHLYGAKIIYPKEIFVAEIIF